LAEYEVVQPTLEHAQYISQHLRKSDEREIYYQSLATPEYALERSLAYSEKCYTCLVDGVPAFMFGVSCASLLANTGIVWMLSTPSIYKISFGREELELMKDYVLRMLDGYTKIENYVYVGNKVSIRWLEFLGFEMDEPQPYGAFQKPFRHFEMRVS